MAPACLFSSEAYKITSTYWEKPESSDCQVVLSILFKIFAKLCLAFKEFYKAHVEVKRPKDFNGEDRGLDIQGILTCVGVKMDVHVDWCQKSIRWKKEGEKVEGPGQVMTKDFG